MPNCARRLLFFGVPAELAIKRTIIGFFAFAMFAVSLGMVSGVFSWSPTADGLFRNALVILFIPALTEELVFRAPLLKWPTWPVAIGLGAAYVLWHPLAAATVLPRATDIFLEPGFLTITAAFAALATYLTIKTKNVLPAILCHWVMVLAWKQLFSGPILIG